MEMDENGGLLTYLQDGVRTYHDSTWCEKGILIMQSYRGFSTNSWL